MCGRYDNLIAREAYRSVVRAMQLPESNFPPRYNIALTDPILWRTSKLEAGRYDEDGPGLGEAR